MSGGGFVVVWASDDQDEGRDGIYAQRYDSEGGAIGSEFQVNTYTSDDQWNPSVAALSGGGFVVTWASLDQYGYLYDDVNIYAQRYDSEGNTVGNEFRVNAYTSNYQGYPSVAALSGGGFVVTWESFGQDGDLYDDANIYAQRYDSDGNAVGSEFQVNTHTSDGQWAPSAVALSGGSFVVAWESEDQDGSGDGIYAQIFGISDTSQTQAKAISEATNKELSHLAVAESEQFDNFDAFTEAFGNDEASLFG